MQKPLSILTFNIHSWATADLQPNAMRVGQLLGNAALWRGAESDENALDAPHVIALQEVSLQWSFSEQLLQHGGKARMHPQQNETPLSKLADQLNCNYICAYADAGLGNAFLYRTDTLECLYCERFSALQEIRRCIREGTLTDNSHRSKSLSQQEDRCMLRATFRHLETNVVFDVYTTHLDHASTPYRLLMIRAFLDRIHRVQQTHAQQGTPNYMGVVLCGDFNAMTASDYTHSYEEKVKQYFWNAFRVRRLDYETCAYVTAPHLPQAGFVDTWKSFNSHLKDMNAATSRIHTRIDYIYSKCLMPALNSHIVHSDLNASDHHPLCTTFDAQPRRVIVIVRGLGTNILDYLMRRFPMMTESRHFPITLLNLPEPSEDLSGGLKILQQKIADNEPHLIVASSRGAQYVSELVALRNRGYFVFPAHTSFLLLSAMCREVSDTNPMLFVHGKYDVTIPLQSVRDLVNQGEPELVQLIPLDSDHSLSEVLEHDLLQQLMIRALNIRDSHVGVYGSAFVPQHKPRSSARHALLSEIRERGDQQSLQKSPSQSRGLKIFLTGFGTFAGVVENPSTLICDFVKQLGDKFPCIKSVHVLEVSIEGVESYFAHTLLPLIEEHCSPHDQILLLHLGVAAASPEFKIERLGVNEATFRVKDERGHQPYNQPIIPQFGIDYAWRTSLRAQSIAKHINKRLCSLQSHDGAPFLSSTRPNGGLENLIDGFSSNDENGICTVSDNAGRFLCNYSYVRSLWHAATKGIGRIHSLFVHVPALTTYPVEKQVIFFFELYDTLTKRFEKLVRRGEE